MTMEGNAGMKSRDVELIRDYLFLMKSYAGKTIDEALKQTFEDREFIDALVKEQRRRIRELDRLIAVTGDEIDVLRAAEQDARPSTTKKEKASKAPRKRSVNATKKPKTEAKTRNVRRSLQDKS